MKGATRAELRHGIGFRIAPPASPFWDLDPWASRATEARGGAAAMRSRAFERRVFDAGWLTSQIHPGVVQAIGQTPVVAGDPRYVAAWPEERVHGCPAWP